MTSSDRIMQQTARIIKHCIFWLLPAGLHAQLLTINDAVITSTTGSTIIVNGSIRNAGSGQLDNNGTITFTGDFTHDAANNCFGTSHGSVVLNGGAQVIGGSGVAVFNDLTLAGTGTKTLQQDVEVGGAYVLPAGGIFLNTQSLDLNTHQLTVRNADPAAITRTTGFIISETDPNAGYSHVRWNIGANAGTYTIPFGNAATSSYLPFTATITTPGVGATGHFRMATYPTLTLANPNNRPLPAGMPGLIDVSGTENAPNVLDRWWIIESGDFSTAPVATAQFTYRDSEWSTGTNTIVEGALQLERQMGVWTMLPTTTNTAANTLTSTGQPLATGIWTAAELNAPLPVELLSFTGKRINGREVQLDWSTATEHNNVGFEVWRMIEGEDAFSEVGWVDGAGNSQQLVNYMHADANTTSKTSYYKLKQVDNDGQFAWTPVVAVEGSGALADIVLFPNPTGGEFHIQGDPGTWNQVLLLDASGRVVKQWAPDARYDATGLPAGVYTVHVMLADGGTQQQGLVVE